MKKIDSFINTIGESFFEFQSKLQFFEREYLKKFDITDVTPNEVKVLYIIGTSNTKSMSDIANELRVTKGTLSISINSLVKKGYVIRTRHKQDRRVIIVYLTRKSLRIVRHYGKFYFTLISKLIYELDEERIMHLAEVLESLNNIIETNFYEGLSMEEVNDLDDQIDNLDQIEYEED